MKPSDRLGRSLKKAAIDSSRRSPRDFFRGSPATRGELADAFDYITQTIRYYYDSGTIELMRVTLGILAALFDRLGNHEPGATISGFAAEALARATFPEVHAAIVHLREVLGDEGYGARAQVGANMAHAEMANYAFDQIDRARAELLAAQQT